MTGARDRDVASLVAKGDPAFGDRGKHRDAARAVPTKGEDSVDAKLDKGETHGAVGLKK